MVSFHSFFLTTLMVFLTVVLTNIIVVYKYSITPNFAKQKFLQSISKKTYRNSIYICLMTFILLYDFKANITLVTISTLIMTYFQSNVWLNFVELKIMDLPTHLRDLVLERLSKDNYTVTHRTFHKFIYDLIVGEFHNFKDTAGNTWDDIKVGIFLMEPTDRVKQRLEYLYQVEKNFFKYKKVQRLDEELASLSDEDYLKAYAMVKRLMDPREVFSWLRRLPWEMSYAVSDISLFSITFRHILVVYNFLKTTIVAVLLAVMYFLYTIFFFKIQFLKQLSVWFVIGMMYFWLISGFNFFLKRYQFGKFTSQIQRFWKRTNTYFWLIEGFLLLLFFYYYLNSSQEPLYMYDYSSLNQEYLVSLHAIALNIILISLIIYIMYFTMLRLNSNSWTQVSLYLILISVFVFFSFFIETYQFYYVISVFNERLWVFNEEENLWGVDIDNPILRTKHQYLLVCLIAKYWHFLFIFLSWVFFLMKSFEKKKVTYVLFGANLQNMIILYALNFACYLQWFKWVYRRFFDLPYTWFFISIDNKFFYRLFSEIKLLLVHLHTVNLLPNALQTVVYKSISFWGVDFLCIWKFI